MLINQANSNGYNVAVGYGMTQNFLAHIHIASGNLVI